MKAHADATRDKVAQLRLPGGITNISFKLNLWHVCITDGGEQGKKLTKVTEKMLFVVFCSLKGCRYVS